MIKEQMLKAVIQKAVEGGWTDQGKPEYLVRGCGREEVRFFASIPWALTELLFSHDFAKAFFGDKKLYMSFESIVYDNGADGAEEIARIQTPGLMWQYHLQQAVISPDPLQYYFKLY